MYCTDSEYFVKNVRLVQPGKKISIHQECWARVKKVLEVLDVIFVKVESHFESNPKRMANYDDWQVAGNEAADGSAAVAAQHATPDELEFSLRQHTLSIVVRVG